MSYKITEYGGSYDVNVTVEPPRQTKRFIGGYRNRLTGVEYHHAAVQTIPRPLKTSSTQLYCRQTQTVCQRHVKQQTSNDMSTQMTGIGLYMVNVMDKLIEPRLYTPADVYLDNRSKNVSPSFYCCIILPRYYYSSA